jgi:hypothetical protein
VGWGQDDLDRAERAEGNLVAEGYFPMPRRRTYKRSSGERWSRSRNEDGHACSLQDVASIVGSSRR